MNQGLIMLHLGSEMTISSPSFIAKIWDYELFHHLFAQLRNVTLHYLRFELTNNLLYDFKSTLSPILKGIAVIGKYILFSRGLCSGRKIWTSDPDAHKHANLSQLFPESPTLNHTQLDKQQKPSALKNPAVFNTI